MSTPSLLRLCARSSPLSLVQVEEVRPLLEKAFPGMVLELVSTETIGDKDQKTDLESSAVPDDFFTRELDDMLRENRADLSIHSAKDLPAGGVKGLVLAALLPAREIRDAMVFREGFGPDHPPRTIGTSSPARRSQLPELFPASEPKSIRGTIGQRLAQLDAGDYDAVIIAACALDRLGLSHRIGQYLPYDPAPQQGRLALVVREDDDERLRALARIDVRRCAGLVAMVGCPADFELISSRARTYLQHADVILHDRLIPPQALEIIGDRGIPVGKTGGEDSTPQSEIHRQLLQASESGKLVVRLHGGEPGILGKLGETLAFCEAWNLRTEVVPAVSAAQVAAARAKTALTHRLGGRSVRFITGHKPDEYNPQHYSGPEQGNLAIFMGVRNRQQIYQRLIDKGWEDDAPLIVGQQLGFPGETIHTLQLRDLPDADIHAPAVYLLGEKSWPGDGYTLFVGSDPLPFLKHGPLLHWPMIALTPRPLNERVAAIAEHFTTCQGVVFPSRQAIRFFMEALMVHHDTRSLAGKKILAVGPQTEQELCLFGLRADAAPQGYGGITALAEQLGEDARGQWFYPCSDAAPVASRAESLRPFGGELSAHVFYENQEVAYPHLPGLPFHRVLFTSGSTARAYFKNFPDELHASRTWIAVGHSTLVVLDALGVKGELLHDEN